MKLVDSKKPRIAEPETRKSDLLKAGPLALVAAVVITYFRVFKAGFVAFDDNIHVYANPFLNPPTLHNLAKLWHQAYEQLYIPLAYTIYAGVARFAQVPLHFDSSIGASVSVAPAAFHTVSVAFHAANVLLCFLLVQRLTRSRMSALLASLVFALHPLQVESVAWIAELRGLSSSFFALLALNGFALSRQLRDNSVKRSRAVFASTTVFVVAAMLCKPAAVVLPLVALAIDRVVFRSDWRRAAIAAAIWLLCTLPFAWITNDVQAIGVAGRSELLERPFIAGDALTFYLFKTFLPSDLCVDYGRTPHAAMSDAWGYLSWAVSAGLLWLAYRHREKRPIAWLGVLVFTAFLLPTLGLVPFAYQDYSTVADRFAYLALIGVGLVVADVAITIRPQRLFLAVGAILIVALGALSSNQSRYWSTSSAFLHHTIEVNPAASFAYFNLGHAERANGNLAAAASNYQACIAHGPTRLKAYVNLAQVYLDLHQPSEAQTVIGQSTKITGLSTDGMTAGDFTILGMVLMEINQPDRAAGAFSAASLIEPTVPHLFNEANALSATGQFGKAEATFRRCVALDPNLAGAHSGLGIVLAETNRLRAAADEFRTAVRLKPDDASARDNLKRAESMLQGQPQ